MTYTVTDIADLVEYHLVASAPDDDAAHANLVQLVQMLELVAPRPLRPLLAATRLPQQPGRFSVSPDPHCRSVWSS